MASTPPVGLPLTALTALTEFGWGLVAYSLAHVLAQLFILISFFGSQMSSPYPWVLITLHDHSK